MNDHHCQQQRPQHSGEEGAATLTAHSMADMPGREQGPSHLHEDCMTNVGAAGHYFRQCDAGKCQGDKNGKTAQTTVRSGKRAENQKQ